MLNISRCPHFSSEHTGVHGRQQISEHVPCILPMRQGIVRLWALSQMLRPRTRSFSQIPTFTTPGRDFDAVANSNLQHSMVPLDDEGLVIPEALQKCQIYQWLRSGDFWSKDFVKDILPQIKIEFGHELQHLKTAKADRKGVGNGRNDTYAMYMFGGEDGTFVDETGVTHDKATTYYEIDRTLTAVRALLWIGNDQVETFNPKLAEAQAQAVKRNAPLEERPWSWIREQFLRDEAQVFLPEKAHLCYGLITSVIVNDVGKDENLAAVYKRVTGSDLQPANHDAYLRACIDAGMVPSINRLPECTRRSVMLGIEVAAECNLGQLAQAENLPASLYPLTRFQNDYTAWRLRFMEQILDLAGARGHINNTAATVFSPEVALGNRYCHTAAEQVINGQSPVLAYDWYLHSRYENLVARHQYKTVLDIRKPSHRALMRIFCLTGCANKTLAETHEKVVLRSKYTESFREEFIEAFREDGIRRPAVQVTYLPALLNGVLTSDWQTADDMERGLAAALKYANRCCEIDPSTREQSRRAGITVMERDIFEVSQWVRLGPNEQKTEQKVSDFVHNPSLLADASLPELVLVNKVEPGFEADFIEP